MHRHQRHSVTRCNVKHCRSNSRDSDTALFHIASSENVCMEWIRLSGQEKLLHSTPDFVLKTFHICEKHFHPSDIVIGSEQNPLKCLKTGAVPAIFRLPHEPISKTALLKWLQQYPETTVQPPLGFEDDPSFSLGSEELIQQKEQLSSEEPSLDFIEDFVTIKEEPGSQDVEDMLPAIHDPGPALPLMQMLLNAHLAKASNDPEGDVPKKIVVPLNNSQLSAQDGSRRVFFLQVEKLPKKNHTVPPASLINNCVEKEEIVHEDVSEFPVDVSQTFNESLKNSMKRQQDTPRSATESVTILPEIELINGGIPQHFQPLAPSQKVVLLQVEKLPKQSTNKPHQAFPITPVNVAISPDGSSIPASHYLPEIPMQLNLPSDSGRRVIFLQVEKLSKPSTNNLCDQSKENKAPAAETCAMAKATCDVNLEPEASKGQKDAGTGSVPSILLCDEPESLKTTVSKTGPKKEHATKYPKKKRCQSVRIKRLEKRVHCLEKLLCKLLDEKLVPPNLENKVNRALKGKSKVKRK